MASRIPTVWTAGAPSPSTTGSGAFPRKLILDRQGRVVRKFVGPVDREKLEAVLTELLMR